MVSFYKIWKKYTEIHLTKKQNEFEQSKKLKIIHLP